MTLYLSKILEKIYFYKYYFTLFTNTTYDNIQKYNFMVVVYTYISSSINYFQ